MLHSIYQLAPKASPNTRYLIQQGRASAVSWKDMGRVEQFIFPGLDPAQKSSRLRQLKSEIGAWSKALLPALIFAGGWALQERPLIATTSLTLLASAAIYGDIKCQGRLRTFETGIGLALPTLFLGLYRSFRESPLLIPVYLANSIAAGCLFYLFEIATTKLSLLEKELFNDSKKAEDPGRMGKSFAALAQSLLPTVGFALYTLPSHFALMGTLGVGCATLWASGKWCNETEAKVVQRDLQAFALGSMVAAMIGFGARSWPIRIGG